MSDNLFTGINLENYTSTKGLIIPHSHSDSKLIAYCSESSEKVFRVLFPSFYVTSFEGLELFSSQRSGNPMRGLSVYGVESVFGIRGSVKDFLKLRNIESLRRTEPLSKREICEIMNNLAGKYEIGDDHNELMAKLNPNTRQAKEYRIWEKKKKDVSIIVESFK